MNKLTYDYAIEVLNDYLGELQPMMADPHVQEIMVNRADDIWYERLGVITHVDDCSIDPDALDRAITILANVNAKAQTPLLDARLPGLRIAAARAPVALHGDMMSIRKHARHRIDLTDYEHSGAFDALPASASHFGPRHNDRLLLQHLSAGGAAVRAFFEWVMRDRI